MFEGSTYDELLLACSHNFSQGRKDRIYQHKDTKKAT